MMRITSLLSRMLTFLYLEAFPMEKKKTLAEENGWGGKLQKKKKTVGLSSLNLMTASSRFSITTCDSTLAHGRLLV